MHPTVRLVAFDGDDESLEQHRLRFVRANRPGNVPVALTMTALSGAMSLWMADSITEDTENAHLTRLTLRIIGGIVIAAAAIGCCLFGGSRFRRTTPHRALE